jgi:23S rRNA pseudouridine2605 synthase
LIKAGKVRLNGNVERDAEKRVDLRRDRIQVDNQSIQAASKAHLMLNKPRGLVTTASDEKGRDTVFRCLEGGDLPFVSPVGRLDQASEGLLLFSNDTAWAARITDPTTRLDKTYHVQVDRVADDELIRRLVAGTHCEGEMLAVKTARLLRHGEKNSWLEMVLDEGRNRHIRRLLTALGVNVLRLVRVAIGPLELGSLPKGAYRHLTPEEVRALAGRARSTRSSSPQ